MKLEFHRPMSMALNTNDATHLFEAVISTPCDVDLQRAPQPERSSSAVPARLNPRESMADQPIVPQISLPPNEVAKRRSLAHALRKLHFTPAKRKVQPAGDEWSLRGRFPAEPGFRCVVTPIDPRPADASTSDAGELSLDHKPAEKRRVPRCAGDTQVTVAVVPQSQGRSESEQRWNFLSTPIRGSVLFLNVNGVSLSLNSPVSEQSDIVLQMTHPTFKQSCTLSARILRCEQIGMLWHVACSFHQPITRELMNSFCQLIQPRSCSDHLA